jgi:large subunit ribosomal protein L10
LNREQKAAVVEDIAAQIGDAQAIFAIDYRGISVPQAAELRAKLRDADASFRVVKNRLTRLAADQAGRDELKELLEGPTALTFVRGDTATAAKAIVTFDREHETLTFKGGFMDGLTLDEEGFKSIARLPSRDVLNGQLAGVVASPITGLVRGLNALVSGLAIQLGAIAEQGLVGGEAPVESSDAPAAGPVAEDEGSDASAAGPVAEDEGSDASAAGPVAEDGPPADSPEDASSTPPAEDESEEEGSDGSDETSNEQTEEEE